MKVCCGRQCVAPVKNNTLLVDPAGGARPDATSGGRLTNMNFPGTLLITSNAPSRLPTMRRYIRVSNLSLSSPLVRTDLFPKKKPVLLSFEVLKVPQQIAFTPVHTF